MQRSNAKCNLDSFSSYVYIPLFVRFTDIMQYVESAQPTVILDQCMLHVVNNYRACMYARLSTWNYNYIHKNNIVYQRLNEDFDTVLRLDQI
jgi:hypothetical protein